MDGTSAELSRMREIREKAKGRSKVAQELAGTDSKNEEQEFPRRSAVIQCLR